MGAAGGGSLLGQEQVSAQPFLFFPSSCSFSCSSEQNWSAKYVEEFSSDFVVIGTGNSLVTMLRDFKAALDRNRVDTVEQM